MIDPIVSVIGGDSHKNTDVRRSMQPLSELAVQSRAAVVGISHFSKGGGAAYDPLLRIAGSVAFSAVPRIVMVVAKVSDGEKEKSILVRAKSNIGTDEGGFEFVVEKAVLQNGICTANINWGAQLSGPARDLLFDSGGKRSENLGAVDVAQKFLSELLANGTVPARSVHEQASQAGHSESSIRRAVERLPIQISKKGRQWEWALKNP